MELSFKYDIGDVVTIDGYGRDMYEIFSVNADYERDAIEEYFDIYYECYNALSEELIIAYEKDIEIVGRPTIIDYERITYLYEKANDIDLDGLITHVRSYSMPVNVSEPKEQKKERNDDVDKIDELLTELQDVQTLINLFGEHEDEERRDYRYIQRKTEIEAQLRTLSEKKGGR